LKSLEKNIQKYNFIIACLILPSLLFNIRYSSLLLILSSLGICLNFYQILNKKSIPNKSSFILYLPFIIYFLSVIVTCIIDAKNGFNNYNFLFLNLSFLIIPLFVFTSNFDKVKIFKIIKKSSILISLIGFVFILQWICYYFLAFKNQQSDLDNWFKKGVTISDYEPNYFKVKLNSKNNKPSVRKILMFDETLIKDTILREFDIFIKSPKKDVWILLRSFNENQKKVWINANTGEIGSCEGLADVDVLQKEYNKYNIKFSNEVINKNREWFYISFVDKDGSYQINSNAYKDSEIFIGNLKTKLRSGKNLIEVGNLFKYNLTSFGYLKSTKTHTLYLGLIFLIAFIFLFYTSIREKYKFTLLIINALCILFLASKTIVICLLISLFSLLLYKGSKLKYILALMFLVIIFSQNLQLNRRVNDFYTTINKTFKKQDLGDLRKLSTNTRLYNYKIYIELIKKNPLVGYGYVNGQKIVKSKYNINLNSHNQYLQSIFSSGIIGLFCFLFFIGSPFFYKENKLSKKNGLELCIVIILITFLFESLLFRQWGLITVSFIYSIYIQYNKNRWSQ
jgi:hypothetical protein